MNFDPRNTVFLIDGSSFLYRAYYGLSPLHTPQGEAVQAVYSFCRMIKKLTTKFSPEFLVLVWDSKGKTTRHELFPSYKATRQAPPSDLFTQKEHITTFAGLIGLFQISQSGIEADDIMFSLAQEYGQQGKAIVFITADKDMGQALKKDVYLYDPFKDVIFDYDTLSQKMEFPIEKLPLYFSMLGDASDNIPGVKGIGKKGATDLAKQFNSIDDLYKHIDQVSKERTRSLLLEHKSDALLSHNLFLLQYHPTNTELSDAAFDLAMWSCARPLFAQLSFKSLVREIDEVAGSNADIPVADNALTHESIMVTSREALQDIADLIRLKGICAIDTETDGLDVLRARLVGISICVEKGKAYYIPCGHLTGEEQLSCDELHAVLQPVFANASIKKYMHHAKFDELILAAHGMEVRGLAFDTMLAARLLLKDWQRVGLKDLSLYYFNEAMLTYDHVVKQAGYKNFSYVPLACATAYAAADAHQTFKLAALIMPEIEAQGFTELYYQSELPLNELLAQMQTTGILVDVGMLKDFDLKASDHLDQIEDKIFANIGRLKGSINLNSPKQIEHLLFTDLQLPPQKKSAKGTGYSTDQEVLQILSKVHPVPGLILQHRELSKLKNTYIEALPTFVQNDGRIHTTFNQIATATGRLASFEPNMQNIPVGSPYGISIRKAFVPAPGYQFLSADYSQIELRVLAHFSKDENLLQAFTHDLDVHTQTAAGLFGTSLDVVNAEQRQFGKRINFSILYGLTPYGLSKDLDISFKDAKHYIERYFSHYPGVRTWMDGVIEQTKKDGYVTTLGGRRRYIPGIYEKNKVLYDEACRIAINTIAQGTAADIMKWGMISVQRALDEKKLDARILLQIHDELLIEVAHHQMEEVQKLVKQSLEEIVVWEIPLKVATSYGLNWDEVS